MHKNYDYILTSSSNTRRYFKDAFGYDINRVIVMPLPRVDYLTDRKRKKEVIKKVIKNALIIQLSFFIFNNTP